MPRLELIVSDELARPFALPTEDGFSVQIGRSDACAICIPIPSVSLVHAIIERVPGGMRIRDLGSTNGLEIDGLRVESAMLSAEHPVKLGAVTLYYAETPEEHALFGSESPQVSLPVDTVAPSVTPPNYGQLHYVDTPADGQDTMSPSIRIEAAKKNYWGMVIYAILIFVMAVGTGMTYRHYKKTGELLPFSLLGKESPKQSILQERARSQG
ncbi:MAG: FHA domain-containing protein [Akkermansia sp.]